MPLVGASTRPSPHCRGPSATGLRGGARSIALRRAAAAASRSQPRRLGRPAAPARHRWRSRSPTFPAELHRSCVSAGLRPSAEARRISAVTRPGSRSSRPNARRAARLPEPSRESEGGGRRKAVRRASGSRRLSGLEKTLWPQCREWRVNQSREAARTKGAAVGAPRREQPSSSSGLLKRRDPTGSTSAPEAAFPGLVVPHNREEGHAG